MLFIDYYNATRFLTRFWDLCIEKFFGKSDSPFHGWIMCLVYAILSYNPVCFSHSIVG